MPQPTLLNFFSRTPKSQTSSPAGTSSSRPSPASAEQKTNASVNGGSARKESPTKVGSTTPVSRSNGQKRRRTSGHTTELTGSNARKKLKNEDSPPSQDFVEGSLVWALIEGYPWWPAMIRGERKGEPVSRKKSLLEFHVQFFDKPPTRAWIRKGDLKPYIGSQDANIPPKKEDKQWVAACKEADDALHLGRGERIKRCWVDFDEDGDDDDDAEEIEEVEEMEVEPEDTSRTPLKCRSSKNRRRVRLISSSDEEESSSNKKSKNGVASKKKDKRGKEKKGNDSGSDYSPTKNGSVEEESEESDSPVESEAYSGTEEEEEDDDRKKKTTKTPTGKGNNKKGTSLPSTPRTNSSSAHADIRDRLQQFNVTDASCASPKSATNTASSTADDELEWEHMSFTWAKEGKRKDLRGRRETDDDYDPKTLLVPLDFLNKLTPANRQWWEFKMRNFDTIIFFKVGKFYEFYHWDACIAVKELGINYMKGNYAHSGFPEIAFSRFANALVEKGYKIARVEQTETPEMMDIRVKKTKPGKFDKVIKREVCQISTKGVRYASFQDEAISNPFKPQSAYLYAIFEKASTENNKGPTFGVCFIDTTIGTFHVGQFCDDRHASRLRTLFSHYVPVQILYEKGNPSPNMQQLLHNMSGVRKDALFPETEFWTAKKVLKFLAEQDYFRTPDSSAPNWPSSFQQTLSKSDGLGLTPDENFELGVKCLGGIVFYLKYCMLDHDLLSQKRFEIYEPVDKIIDSGDGDTLSLPERCLRAKYMVLDGITIRNLEILDGPLSLFAVIDKCGTNFGKRLLRHWLCLPLALPDEIKERQDAIEELMRQRECRDKIIPLMKGLPDLERLLSKIHYLGSAHRSKNHPDGRASFYEDIKYSKNKIADFLSTLRGFKTCVNIIKELKGLEDDELSSTLICQLLHSFPDLEDLLNIFENAFDHQLAAKEGKIEPKSGIEEEFDQAVQAIVDIQAEADAYLKVVSKELHTRATYFGTDKKRFQIEVPEQTKVSKDYEMSSRRKGYKRYLNSTTKEFLSAIMKAEAERDEVLRDIARKIFEKFDKHRETWSKAVECIATLDVLISLSIFSESQEVMCRPMVSLSKTPFIKIKEGCHPCIFSDTYIPNNTVLGLDDDEGESKGSFVILTGPNMGGKSTLMRQVGLLAVLSHLGCYVPAEGCEMSVIDRIFTRLGANDNIGEGESTFYVEMSETSSILRHATADSLLLIDELGRGTATYDGTAIAYATAKELSSRKCRALFSTHYHTLVEALQEMPAIQMSHMACMVENENEDDPTQESITFLYKMISGPCPKSYGFNAARLAGISDQVVRVAHKKAKEFESVVAGVRAFTSICSLIQNEAFSMDEFAALKI